MRAERSLVAAAAVLATAVFAGSWAIVQHRVDRRQEIVDTPLYQAYGDAMTGGEVPYRDFRLEYPPAALPAFVVPSLIGRGDSPGYRRAFGWVMAVCGAATVLLGAATLHALGAAPGRLAAGLAFAALWPLALGPVVLTRFDLWPAVLTLGALAALLAGYVRLGAGVLGLGVAAKLFPAVLVPLAAVWVWRRRGPRGLLECGAVFAAVLVAIFVPFLVLSPDGLSGSIGRQLSRPLQIESLGAAVLVWLHDVASLDVQVVSSSGSQNVGGTLGDAVGVLSTGVQLAALVYIWGAFARGPATPERLVRFAALALVVFVAFGKVLSPQFMIWLVPVVPLVAGRRGLVASGLLAAALLLTRGWFPYRYWDYARDLDEHVTWLVLARDVALVALAGVLAWSTRPAAGPARRNEPVRPDRTRSALPRS